MLSVYRLSVVVTQLITDKNMSLYDCTRQGHNHVFKVGSNSLVYGITTLLQKKLDRSTQFGAVGYIITLYSLKSYVKSWGGPSKFRGGPDPTDPPVVAPMARRSASSIYCRTMNYGQRSFSYSDSAVWNSLPLMRFCARLKTAMFCTAYDSP